MPLFGLICHYCGKRSGYRKGTSEFQCPACDARNFFDARGNVADPPAFEEPLTSQQAPNLRSSFSEGGHIHQQQEQTFCNRCLNNQRIYVESLARYLPDDVDESDPIYRKFEAALPAYKAQLEQRYPQVCKRCAYNVQKKVHEADYDGSSRNAAATTRRKIGRSGDIGSRDDWYRSSMRLILSLAGAAVYISLLVQAAWHIYGIMVILFPPVIGDDFLVEPGLKACAKEALISHFDQSCYDHLGEYILTALFVTACLLWYNHGIRQWYHSTHRIGSIIGQMEHFWIQVAMLVGRSLAWYALSTVEVSFGWTSKQVLAAHSFSIVLLLLGQRASELPIKTERWKIQGRFMPDPGREDVFGATAGPSEEASSGEASSIPPVKLFARDERPFPISTLAQRNSEPRGYSRLNINSIPPPSPPDSPSVSDHGDAMEIDSPYNTNRSAPLQTGSIYSSGVAQSSGWTGMRNEMWSLQGQARAGEPRKRSIAEQSARLESQPCAEPSPFRGRLPAAPMSMERRLRAPVSQLKFKETPQSEKKDFMERMRGNRTGSNGHSSTHLNHETGPRHDRNLFDNDLDFSPARARTRGNLDLYDSGWRLPEDGRQTTELEELLGGQSFSLEDRPAVDIVPIVKPSMRLSPSFWLSLLGILAALFFPPVRRFWALWLYRKIDELGY